MLHIALFFHAGNSSFHSFGWPPVLISFSMRSSVIHLVSFLSSFALSLSRAHFFFVCFFLESKASSTPKMVHILTGYLAHPFLPLYHIPEIQQWFFCSAHNKNLFILCVAAQHWCSPLLSTSKHLRIWMLTSQCRNQSGMCIKVSFVYKLDYLHIIPALEWLGQTFTAKSAASWPCFLPTPGSNRTCLLLQLL